MIINKEAKMLFDLIKGVMAYEELDCNDLEDRYGRDYRNFFCDYEAEIYKPDVRKMLRTYTIPQVVGAIHNLYQLYKICEDTEDELYSFADPNEEFNEPSEYDEWTEETNPLIMKGVLK